jgi:GNAT superfamily N-acetyltransferase
VSAKAAQLRETGLRFGREGACAVVPDMQELVSRHWREVGHYEDMPIDPDYLRYQQLEAAGVLRTFTARVAGALVGYGIFLVAPGLHYRTVLMAQETTLYLAPEYRRGTAGLRFMRYVDEQLIAEGVTHISRHVKQRRDHGKLLERMGYQLQDTIYTKKL